MNTLIMNLNEDQNTLNQGYIISLIKDMQNYDEMKVEGFLNSKHMNEFDRLLIKGIEMRKKVKTTYKVSDNYKRIIDEKNLKYRIIKQD